MRKREATYDRQHRQRTNSQTRWLLVFYDALAFALTAVMFLMVYPSSVDPLNAAQALIVAGTCFTLVFVSRFIMNVYRQIWRYSAMEAYIRLIFADAVAGILFLLSRLLPFMPKITLPRAVALVSIDLLIVMSMRILYQYMYQTGFGTPYTRLIGKLFNIFCGTDFRTVAVEPVDAPAKVRVAIVGAGDVGVMLADEMNHNPRSFYEPVCFVDNSDRKSGREVLGIPVISEKDSNLKERLFAMGVQEAIFAITQMEPEAKKHLYDMYSSFGLKVKVYDYPTMQEAGSKRQLREFDIEELLFRAPRDFLSDETKAYYRDKVVLITGGGGSIGSEMCRQIAKCEPKQLVIFDVYENGAYDIQQELKINHGVTFDVRVEIATMCDLDQLRQIFGYFRPDIVIHAAAHKHVPLMQRNSIEAVKNNVFGTANILVVCEEFGVKRFMMVSTDKAVNPTNVMGATKRMCEMMVLNHRGNMLVSATRFGNVLGSAGSVVPLFRRQIKNGGPITITDKRIVRYFMTIPEASQLVLTSGAMAKNRELFVLDMGKPVRILDMAENMVRLSGLEPYRDIDIIETGLRPGEKLYEELLIKSETLTKTDNDLIFIEKETTIPPAEIAEKLRILQEAVDSLSPARVRDSLFIVVPTYRTPEEVNAKASEVEEMKAR